jgi:hypothetical protein
VSAEPLGVAETGRHSRVRGRRFFLAHYAKIDALAKEIRAARGVVQTAEVDAFDDQAVESTPARWLSRPEALTSPSTRSAFLKKAFIELSAENFAVPILTYTRAHFLTARAAARHNDQKGLGHDTTITATPARSAALSWEARRRRGLPWKPVPKPCGGTRAIR